MSKPSFSIADLQQGSKRLNSVETMEEKKPSRGAEDDEALTALGKVILFCQKNVYLSFYHRGSIQ
jgi:hypothetical protein